MRADLTLTLTLMALCLLLFIEPTRQCGNKGGEEGEGGEGEDGEGEEGEGGNGSGGGADCSDPEVREFPCVATPSDCGVVKNGEFLVTPDCIPFGGPDNTNPDKITDTCQYGTNRDPAKTCEYCGTSC